MELVYLWIEDYKNIQKQGFNFSPRFTCEFKDEYDENGKLKDDCELVICDKKKKECEDNDYIENFFGDNINVTAIVGKNGSGKSSVLEFILDRLADRHDIYPKNYIFIYYYENELHKYSNFEYKISHDLSIEEYPNGENLLEYYKNIIALHINSEYKDVEARDTQQLFSENNKYNKNSSNLVFVKNYIHNKEQLEKIKENFFTPHILRIRIKTRDYYSSVLYDDRDYYSPEDWNSINDLIKSLDTRSFIERLGIIKNIFELKYDKHTNKDVFTLFGDRNSPDKYRRFDPELLKNIPSIFKDNTKENIEIEMNNTDADILSYIRKLPYIFEIDLIDKNKISINSLSFGEKQLLTQLHYILNHVTSRTYEYYVPPYQHRDENGEEIGDEEGDYIDDINIEACLIFVDEFEIGLHPEWQKNTIQYIISFLEVLNIKIHIILTSHSPFLISDIPKQNIIFLDKDEKGNCKVVAGLKEKKQTFGANIHTLLSDSFFMEDGLMGEFAKGKIDKAIVLLNKENLDEEELKYCEQIISIIGEPIVKNQLQRMLDSKRLSKIDAVNEKIKNMSYELEILKKHQSKIVQDELRDKGKKQYKQRLKDD